MRKNVYNNKRKIIRFIDIYLRIFFFQDFRLLLSNGIKFMNIFDEAMIFKSVMNGFLP